MATGSWIGAYGSNLLSIQGSLHHLLARTTVLRSAAGFLGHLSSWVGRLRLDRSSNFAAGRPPTLTSPLLASLPCDLSLEYSTKELT